MVDPANHLCPLNNFKPCSKDCAWIVEAEACTEDWIANDYFCSMNLIATQMSGFIEVMMEEPDD